MRKQEFSFKKRFLVCMLTVLMVCGIAPGVFAEDEPVQAEDVTKQTVQLEASADPEQAVLTQEEDIASGEAAKTSEESEATVQEEAAKAYVRLSGTTSLKGRDLKDKEFSITLKDVTDSKNPKTMSTVQNDGKGTFAFVFPLYEAGEYNYEISQDTSKKSGITIDSHVYNVKVIATDGGNGELTVKVVDEKNKELDLDGFTFTNQYSVSVSKDATTQADSDTNDKDNTYTFSGKVSLTGKTLAKDEFSFTLEDTTESTPEADRKTWTVKNDSSGNFVFDAITYEKAGEYTYTISQVKNTESGMTNDTNVYKATVTVTAADDGTLTTKLTKLTKGTNDTDVLSSGISFSNQYVTPTTTNTTTTPSTTTTTPSTGTADATTARATSNPSTGDTSDIGFYSALLAGFVIVLVCTLFSFRRKKDERH